VAWIKQNIDQNKTLPQILRSVELSLPSSLQPLIEMDFHPHRQITQPYKQEMITILKDTIETKLYKSQLLLNHEITKICQNQSILPLDQQFNHTMTDLLQRHLILITEKIQYMYHYKDTIMNLI